MTLWSLKIYSEIVIRLKAIKYKEDSFCYLFSYHLDFGLQAAYFLTLFFWLNVFKTFVSLAERIYLLKLSQISDPSKQSKPPIAAKKWVNQIPRSCICWI